MGLIAPWRLPDQGLNLCLLPWQADSLPLSHQGSPTYLFLFHLIHITVMRELVSPPRKLTSSARTPVGSLVAGVRCQDRLRALSTLLHIEEVSPTFSDPAQRNGHFQNDQSLGSDKGEFTVEPLAGTMTSQTQVPLRRWE